MRWARWGAAILSALMLAGCGDREGSERAAIALAEAVYPGEFEFYDSYLQKGYYDVALVKSGDPLTRMRFNIDPDPAKCGVGTACEQRLRRAHDSAVLSGIKVKALNAAFSQCGIALLGIHEAQITPAFRTVLELDLDPANQQPALDRLTPCIARYRQGLPADADTALRTLALRILRPTPGQPAKAAPMTLDSRLPDNWSDEPSYQISIGADQEQARAADLRLYVHYISASGLDDRLADVARSTLAKDPLGGHVPNYPVNWQLKLDPQRLDVIRTYVLACSMYKEGQGPCQADIAVSMRYDLARGEASEVAVVRNIRDARGLHVLQALPGR